MKHRTIYYSALLSLLLIVAWVSTGAHAQDDANVEETKETIEALGEEDLLDVETPADFKKDSTGTNPLNFTFDARLYNEFQWLNTAGDGDQNITTFEFRAPLFDNKWQLRAKIRTVYLEADLNDDGNDDIDEFGFGDMDIRILTIPYLNMQKKVGLAPGLEVFINSASDDALGSGALVLGPVLFGAYFNPFGIPGSIVVPGYQHKFSVYEEDGRSDVHQGLIDFFMVKTFNNNLQWAFVDPQILLDYENDKEFMLLEIQAGTMLNKLLGLESDYGHSVYIMPSFGIGEDRPYDFSFEAGYKIVWR